MPQVIHKAHDRAVILLGRNERHQPDISEGTQSGLSSYLSAIGPGQRRQVRMLHVGIDARVAGVAKKLAARILLT